jgi:hypothetical protein
MFIANAHGGYKADGQQYASGLFLILTQPKTDSVKYPMHLDICRHCGKPEAGHPKWDDVPTCPEHGIVARIRRLRDQHATDEEVHRIADTPERDVPTEPDCPICESRKRILAETPCLAFVHTSPDYPIRAIVRRVSMHQCGHWMMGTARAKGQSITVSGSYGGDGLPCSVPDSVYELGLELPADLHAAWNTGGGWNGAGSEAPAMRAWALAHLDELR